MLRLQQSEERCLKKINNANAKKPDTVCYNPPLASRGHCNPSTQDGGANRSGFQGNSEGELQELVVMVSGFF